MDTTEGGHVVPQGTATAPSGACCACHIFLHRPSEGFRLPWEIICMAFIMGVFLGLLVGMGILIPVAWPYLASLSPKAS